MTQTLTVLSGDVVGSTQLSGTDQRRVFEALRDGAGRIADWLGNPVQFTRNRGDGWQICLPGARPGLRAALGMRAALRAEGKTFETRIAIASGPGEIPPNGDLNIATGPVFVAAGRALDALDGPYMVHAGGGALGATVRLADHISAGWTPAQARAVLPMLAPAPPTHAAAARDLGISRQAVDQALNAAGFAALLDALALLDAAEDESAP